MTGPLHNPEKTPCLLTNTDMLHQSNSIYTCFLHVNGPGSLVGIATRYGLEGLGIESRWWRDYPHLTRLALGPTQPPVKWVPGLSRG